MNEAHKQARYAVWLFIKSLKVGKITLCYLGIHTKLVKLQSKVRKKMDSNVKRVVPSGEGKEWCLEGGIAGLLA